MEVKKETTDKGTVIPPSSELVLDGKMSRCERSLRDLWREQEELAVQLVKGDADCLQKFILCKRKITELQAVMALRKGTSESAKNEVIAEPKEKPLRELHNLPRLDTAAHPSIYHVLRFKSEFEAKMRNCIPNEEERKRYLLEAVSGPTRWRMNQLELRKLSLQGLMEFVLEDAIGSDWPARLKKELHKVKQGERENILEFSERLGLYLDVLGLKRNSSSGLDWLSNGVRKEFRIYWENTFGTMFTYERRWNEVVRAARNQEGTEGFRIFQKTVREADEEERGAKRTRGRAYERRQFDGECLNCGKTGHKKKDCWSKGGGAAGKGPRQTREIKSEEPKRDGPKPDGTKNVKQKSETTKKRTDKETVTCFACQKEGHFASRCPNRKVNGFVEERGEEEINDQDDEYLMLTEESYLCALTEPVGKGPIMPLVDPSKKLIPVTWGENALDVFSIYDPGTTITLADESIWKRLDGDVKKVNKSITGIGGKPIQVTQMKMVTARTPSCKAILKVYCCDALGEDRILLNAEDGRKLGVEITGIPATFWSQTEAKAAWNNEEWLDGTASNQKEEKWPIGDIQMIEKGIANSMQVNQQLPDNTTCVLPGAEFVVQLNDTVPTYTRQYPIPESLKGKVEERINEWKKKG